MDKQQYERAQKVTFKSFETKSKLWREGQQRFIRSWLLPYKESKILDCACGDGVGLNYFYELGFRKVSGLEWEPEKAQMARHCGFPVFEQDFHDEIPDNFDLIYSSHSLEHALQPDVVLRNFRRHCKELIVVIPFPDPRDITAHCAKQILGSDQNDEGVKVIAYIESFGFKLKRKQFDTFREEEIWMHYEIG